MSSTDAYFAGLIDGEGSFVLQHQGAYRPNCYKPMIQVNMTDEAVIADLHATYGGQMRSKKVYNGNKPQFLWRVQHRQAEAVILRLLPFLRVKRADAEKMLTYLKSKKRRGEP